MRRYAHIGNINVRCWTRPPSVHPIPCFWATNLIEKDEEAVEDGIERVGLGQRVHVAEGCGEAEHGLEAAGGRLLLVPDVEAARFALGEFTMHRQKLVAEVVNQQADDHVALF